MNDQEINYALALAIGWPLDTITFEGDAVHVDGRVFDYQDTKVILPIAKQFEAKAHSDREAALTVIELSWLLGDSL